jgi:glyoxylase-like metal-dependent hydrolase (beta-lactamase superfamily II)
LFLIENIFKIRVGLLINSLSMRILPIYFSPFKAKGTAMFGSAPGKTWQKLYPDDELGRCSWALRSLLIDDGENIVLIDSGFGNSNKYILIEYCLDNFETSFDILNASVYKPEQITHVVHTHLHVDHCGGSFLINEKDELSPAFPNAVYIVSQSQLETALNPSDFERSSFQPEIISEFANHKKLQLIKNECFPFPWLELDIFNGHTKDLIIPVIHTNKKPIVFAGDLIPSATHLNLQATMDYDINRLLSLTERENFLEEAFENDSILFFQHDLYYECCSLKKENSRVLSAEFFKLSDIAF